MSARNFELNGTKKAFGNVKIDRQGNTTKVILHSTAVVEVDYSTNSVKLNSGGWLTPTTKTAINNALKQISGFESVFVSQKKGEWTIQLDQFKTADFVDGIKLVNKNNSIKVV